MPGTERLRADGDLGPEADSLVGESVVPKGVVNAGLGESEGKLKGKDTLNSQLHPEELYVALAGGEGGGRRGRWRRSCSG